MALLGTDPGAWNIAGWICVILIVGGVILWVVTMLMLRGDGGAGAGKSGTGPARPGPAPGSPSSP